MNNTIDFACQNIDLTQVVRCSLGLTRAEYRVLINALKTKNFTVEKMSNKMGLDRTTIQKGLSKLLKKGLVERRQLNRDSGGYTYVYAAKDVETVKKKVKTTIRTWAKRTEKEVETWQ